MLVFYWFSFRGEKQRKKTETKTKTKTHTHTFTKTYYNDILLKVEVHQWKHVTETKMFHIITLEGLYRQNSILLHEKKYANLN